MTDKKPDSEDLELFKKCAQGDKKAWKLFVNKYSCLIYSSIHKIFKIKNFRYTKDDVDDLFSDIFLKLFENNCKKLHQFEGKNGCSPATWIRTIATRIVLDFLRTHKESDSIDNQNENENSPAKVLRDERELPDEKIKREEMEKLKEKIINELSPEDQLFLTLYYEREMEPEEIADTMNLSLNAIYSKKSRLLDKFEKILKKFDNS